MARKNSRARKVIVDQISGYCTYHENVLRYKKMARNQCLECAERGGKCKHLIDRGEAKA